MSTNRILDAALFLTETDLVPRIPWASIGLEDPWTMFGLNIVTQIDST